MTNGSSRAKNPDPPYAGAMFRFLAIAVSLGVTAFACSVSESPGGGDGRGSDATCKEKAPSSCEGAFECSNSGISGACPRTSYCVTSASQVRCVPAGNACPSRAGAAQLCSGAKVSCDAEGTGITVQCPPGSVMNPGGGGGNDSDDPDNDACIALWDHPVAELVYRAPPGVAARLAGLTADSAILYTSFSGGISAVAKEGGALRSVYSFTADDNSVDRPWVDPNGRVYFLRKKAPSGNNRSSAVVEVDVGSGAAREIGLIPSSGLLTVAMQLPDEVVVFDESARTLWGVPTSSRSVRQLAQNVTMPLGVIERDLWTATPTGVTVLDSTGVRPPREIALSGFGAGQVLVSAGGIFLANGAADAPQPGWMSASADTLAPERSVNDDPSVQTDRGVFLARDVDHSVHTLWTPFGLYGLQQSPRKIKLKSVPLATAPATLLACSILDGLAADTTHVYFMTVSELRRYAHRR